MVPSGDDSVAEALVSLRATAWPPAADGVVIAILVKAMPPPASGLAGVIVFTDDC